MIIKIRQREPRTVKGQANRHKRHSSQTSEPANHQGQMRYSPDVYFMADIHSFDPLQSYRSRNRVAGVIRARWSVTSDHSQWADCRLAESLP
jgi:RNA:NAD 2'-phosphotransferase (TPT1/KptA family)